MNLNSHRSPCCDSDEQRSAVNNTSNEYNQTGLSQANLVDFLCLGF
ncbi:hypothetical protein [Pseudoalteromonas sp. SG44-17]|nr:hypothetical protein [Pseudoalteromonas sp. SG44-17]MBB1411418.1 hypothetical protein [Pseudoalteromonas sp. SG44-17]